MPSMNAASSVSQASSRSRSSALRAWRSRAAWLRLAAGPLALIGFFLPWANGPGALSGTEFTGFTLVGFAGRLQALDLSPSAGGLLWAGRVAILGVAIAGAWQTLLAPGHRHHFGYPLSGWYLAGAATVCAAIGLLRAGLAVPPAGLACLGAAALCFVVARLAPAASRDSGRAGLPVEDPPFRTQ
jgi:hypothetical protein